jgi:hypothetical protein
LHETWGKPVWAWLFFVSNSGTKTIDKDICCHSFLQRRLRTQQLKYLQWWTHSSFPLQSAPIGY